jgi:hypothetical protein
VKPHSALFLTTKLRRLTRCLRELYTVALLAAAAPGAQAVLIDTRPAANNAINSFGEPATATFGQTVTVPLLDTVLDSFSFRLNDSVNPDTVDFAAYVMAWNGTRATGPILYQSGMKTTTNNGGLGGFEEFTFSTGGLPVTAGAKYVLFLSASSFFDSSVGTATMQDSTTNPYSGGDFVADNNGSNLASLTAHAWSFNPGPGIDAAFTASFSAPGPIPEPTTAIFGAGLIGVVGLARRRTRSAAMAV